MSDDFRRTMRSFFDIQDRPVGESCWQPSADVYRGSDQWLVKLDMAGVRPDDVSLKVDKNQLIVQGVRRDLEVLQNQQAYSMEISYNSFEKRINLPMDVENSKIEHEYRDGMFLILIHV